MKIKRPRLWIRIIAGSLLAFVVLGVWITRQFPSLTSSPKTSVELLEDLFSKPVREVVGGAGVVIDRVKLEAVALFIRASDLEEDVEGRLLSMVRGDQFTETTVPFIFYLYELYGTSLDAEAKEASVAIKRGLLEKECILFTSAVARLRRAVT